MGEETPDPTLDVLSGLRNAVGSLEQAVVNLASQDYIDQARKEEERRRRNFGLLVIAVGLCFVIMFGMLTYGLFVVSRNSQINRNNTDYLIECTTPSEPGDPHECWDENTRRSNDLVSVIVDRVVKEVAKDHRRRNR
jgi:hypothetical protein